MEKVVKSALGSMYGGMSSLELTATWNNMREQLAPRRFVWKNVRGNPTKLRILGHCGDADLCARHGTRPRSPTNSAGSHR